MVFHMKIIQYICTIFGGVKPKSEKITMNRIDFKPKL